MVLLAERPNSAHAALHPCLAGDEAVIGSCPEAKLLQKAMQACPYSAGWDTCDTSLCEFSTPSFIPSRVQPLDLGSNATATGPTINEASPQQPNTTGELPFFDTYPGPICFPDVARTPMVLHWLLGVSAGMSQALDKLQARCVEAEDLVYDVARGVAACGRDMFSYDSSRVYKAVGLPKPAAAAPPAANVPMTTTAPPVAAQQPAAGSQQQGPKVAVEIGSRVGSKWQFAS